jgi:hypothetical protein
MRGIRTEHKPLRAWLQVNKGATPRPGYITLHSELFDGTPFEFTVANHEFEDQGPDSLSLVEVGLVGNVGNIPTSGIYEIILPTPVLTLGHNVRVNEHRIIKWDVYQNLKERK